MHKIHASLSGSFGLQVRQLGDTRRATEFARLREQLIASGAVKALVAPRRCKFWMLFQHSRHRKHTNLMA